MPQRLRPIVRERSKPVLHIASSPRDEWDGVVGEWLHRVASDSWQQALPSVVVVPTRSYANALKGRLLQNGTSQLGLHFVTPPGLRDFLALGNSEPSTAWPHLGLLLAVAAEEIAGRAGDTDWLAAKAIARVPDPLLRTLDRLEAAGWDFNDLQFPSFAPIVARFREHLSVCGFDLPARLARASIGRARDQPPKIGDLLITGFNGAHWPQWFSLRAAVESAQRATVILQNPREEARDLDETWVGTWEEKWGEALPFASNSARSETLFPDLFEPAIAVSSRHTHFLVGRTVSEQAKAVVALAQNFLGSATADRVGILFPGAGALPRTVAALLREAEIPHYDGVAHLAPGPLEDEAWSAWLDLQENPRLRILLRFLRASPAAANLFGGLRIDRVEDILRRSYRNLLVDDLELLRAYCLRHSTQDGAAGVAQGLQAIHFLPERATLAGFLAGTREFFALSQWDERQSHLDQTSIAWRERVQVEFSRATFLRWLKEISASLLPVRDREGNHPYSRVQLLFYPHAEGQLWSHLIFTGLNEGSWPPRSGDSGLLDDRDIAELNGRIRKLNRGAIRQGNQGEGHSLVAEGKSFYLGPTEHRALAERQLQNLRESVTVAIGASANLVEENAPERFANPSEFFTRLYHEARGEAPGQNTMAALERQTTAWLKKQEKTPAQRPASDLVQTAIAYEARNKPEVAFGEYEFALRNHIDREVTLSATDWERVIKAPALVWLKKFLGVEAAADDFTNWNMAMGQWVHDWLSHIAKSDGAFVERPRADDVRGRVQDAARQFRADVCALLGRPLPDWWISAWNQAAFIADTLAETITTTENWSHFATEWTLPPSVVRISETNQFEVRGRVDLLIAKQARADGALPFDDIWIIDYKTGRRTSLAPGRKSAAEKAVEDFRIKLLEGKGVQLAIYALALHALGAHEVGLSLLTRELELDRPQVSFAVVEAQRDIWEEFARINRDGVFGMRGSLRGEFRFQNDYPLATLGFDPDFLEEKWNATHPALPKIEKRP